MGNDAKQGYLGERNIPGGIFSKSIDNLLRTPGRDHYSKVV